MTNVTFFMSLSFKLQLLSESKTEGNIVEVSALYQGNQAPASLNPESVCALVLHQCINSWLLGMSTCLLLAIKGLVLPFLSMRTLGGYG